MHIFSVLGKRPMNILKTSQGNNCSVTSLERPQEVKLNINHKIGF